MARRLQLNSTQLNSTQLNSTQLNSTQLNSTQQIISFFKILKNFIASAFSKMIFEGLSLLIIMLMLTMMLLAPLTAFGKSKGNFLMMTAQPGGKATDQFDCRSKIYVEIFLSKLSEEHHKLEAFWYNPAGQRQEYTKYEFTGNHALLWLELHPSFGWKLFSGIDPSAGMSDFVGKWKVELYLDERFLERKVFYVV